MMRDAPERLTDLLGLAVRQGADARQAQA